MRVDGGLTTDLDKVADNVRQLEEMGYSGAMTAETSHDPFFPLLLAAGESKKIELMTSIAVAFARTPMVLANIGHDLNAYSKGRFIMGLGSQIKPHITKRFSMPWSSPAPRMREFILAMRAIWDTWYNGTKLDFRGEFYQHSLMTPFFTPTNTEFGAPKVFLAAVGPLMSQVAGEVADGMIVHAFTTEEYLRGTTLPNIEKGLAAAGRKREDFQVAYPCFVVTGTDERSFAQAKETVTRQIGFYGSTPAYKGVLDSIGAGELQPVLNTMSKEGKWKEMGELITDDILQKFAVVAEPKDVAAQMKQRYGDIIDRTSAAYGTIPAEEQKRIIDALQTA
ncbi:MAG: TIGR03617 family F420-dependent LLM class oxidoreductase [Gammaproteobacteria bacterium]|nr:MAG: TIGR03617 family F420-dependent LLM class oxidoreductase [Gammaproteobacteria bacterium]